MDCLTAELARLTDIVSKGMSRDMPNVTVSIETDAMWWDDKCHGERTTGNMAGR